MGKPSKYSQQDPTALIEKWATEGSDELGPDLRSALQELVRRRIGDVLLEVGLWAPIEVERVASEVVGHMVVGIMCSA